MRQVNLNSAQARYVAYVQQHFPLVYTTLIAPKISAPVTGLGDDSSSSWLDILNSVTDAIPAVATAYSASQAAQLAQATAQARAATIPVATTSSGFSISPTWILVGGAALAALLLLRN